MEKGGIKSQNKLSEYVVLLGINGELICFFNLKGPMMRKEKIMCRRVVAIVAVVMLAMAVGQVYAQAVEVPINGEFNLYKPGTNYTVGAVLGNNNSYAQGVGDGLTVIGGGGAPIAYYADSTTGTVVDCPGWTGPYGTTGGNDLFNNGVDGSCAFSAFGTWSGGKGTLVESAEPLGTIIGASTYTLSAVINGPAGPLVLDLLADGVAITPSSSVTPPDIGRTGWMEISRTYSPAAIAPYIGQSMTIVLGVYEETGVYFGNRVAFDNVTLTQELPPPYPITPGNGGTVGIDFDLLEWTFGEPNDPVGGTVSCDVWFSDNYPNYGQEPNNPDFTDYATKIVNNEPVESVSLSSLIPPIELEVLHTYYWRVDMYDDSLPEPPAQPFISSVFIFNTNNVAPVVDAGTAEPTWLGEGGTVDFDLLGELVSDDELPVPATLLWTVADPSLTILTDPTLPGITVRSTGSGLFVVTLTADDTDLTGFDTVSVLIYPDWCTAIKALEGLTPRMTDHNGDCVTDVLDFAIFAREWLLRIDESL
jgi:hypothetical protein